MSSMDLLEAIGEIRDDLVFDVIKSKSGSRITEDATPVPERQNADVLWEDAAPEDLSAGQKKRRALVLALLALAAVAVLVAVILKLVPSPGKSVADDPRENTGMTLADSLLLTAEIPEAPEELHCYTMEHYAADEERAVSALMSHEPDQRLEWAMGPQYVYRDLEYLQLNYEVVCGGLQYLKYIEGLDRDIEEKGIDQKSNSTRRVFPNNGENTRGMQEYLAEFSTDKVIGSIRQEEVEKRLALLWEQLDFPDLEIRACYTRDKDTLNRNLKEYISDRQEQDPDYLPDYYTFTEEDEDYLIYYRQQIDGISLASQSWWAQTTSEPTQTTFTVWYSPLYGLTYLYVSNLYNVKEKLTSVEIAGPNEAIDRYMQEYDKSIHFGMTEITDIELCYIVVHEEDALIARPAWILTVLKDSQVSGSDIRIYEVTAIDAESLEILKSVNAGN